MNELQVEFDEAKRRIVLTERGLDFEEAGAVFLGRTFTLPDERRDYGEPRFLTHGLLRGDVVMVVGTPRGDRIRIISMRRCHAAERNKYFERMGRS